MALSKFASGLAGLAFVGSLLLLSGVGGAEPATDSADKDYQQELPRIPAKSPADAMKTFSLRPGFRIEQVAAEPLVQDPIAIAFDENGRLFVAEFPEYNQYANPNFKGHGRVRMLEDIDEDGKFDKSTIFADGLNSPTGLACYDGGLFIGVAPDIVYCKDTNGDGKADERKVVFTGFGRDPAGEALLNSFQWGCDNRFHVSTSLSGGDVRAAGAKESEAVSVRGYGFLFDPRSLTFERTSGGGQYGMTLDDWGRAFVCSNSDPIQMLTYDSRYLARNPYVEAPPAAISIATDGKHIELFRTSQVEPWRVLRTRLRSKGIVKGSDEGGKPSGFFTGATGVTVYRGNAWPEEYRGNVFVGDVSNNIVFRAKLEPKDVELVASRADAGADFVASSDIWFRPVQFANAPDGNLYVVDMYRELIEGAAFLPPQILKHLDVASGTDRGRIYRIIRDDFKQPKLPRLGKATTPELVALLESDNGWHRDTASRLIYERQDKSAVEPLQKLAIESKVPVARMSALHSLDGLGALDATLVLKALADPNPRVREHAVRLSERFAAESADLRAKLETLTDDQDMLVRYQLAFSLGALPSTPGRDRALATLLRRERTNRWFQLAVFSSLNEGRGNVFRNLMSYRRIRECSVGRETLVTLATQIGAANKKNDIAAVLRSVNLIAEKEKALAGELIRGLVARQKSVGGAALTGAEGEQAAAILKELVQNARKVAPDKSRPLPERIEAIRTLGLADVMQSKELFGKLLEPKQPQEVQQATLESLGQSSDPLVATLLLGAWPHLSPQIRAQTLETLLARPMLLAAFLDAVEQGTVLRADLDPARIHLLQNHPDSAVRERAKRLFATSTLPRRQEVVSAYQGALQLKGDPAKGKVVFKNTCSACHKLEGVGQSVGEDLAAIRNRGTEAILLNILDPNREVKPQFLSYVLAADDGRIITGMIVSETANSITLRRPDGTSVTILRLNIEEFRSTGLSYMPEGLEKQIDLQGMSDLLAYLNSVK